MVRPDTDSSTLELLLQHVYGNNVLNKKQVLKSSICTHTITITVFFILNFLNPEVIFFWIFKANFTLGSNN